MGPLSKHSVHTTCFADLAQACQSIGQRHNTEQRSCPDALTMRAFHVSEVARVCSVDLVTINQVLLSHPGLPQGRKRRGRPGLWFDFKDLQTIKHHIDPRTPHSATPIVAVSNFKGGVGKTSLTAHLAMASALDGYKVLMIDSDPQGSLSAVFARSAQDEWQTIYPLFARDFARLSPHPTNGLEKALTLNTRDLIQPTHCPALDIIPAELSLSWAEFQIPVWRMHIPTWRLWEALLNALHQDKVPGDYDLVFIDTPPALGYLTINGLTAADVIVVPLGASLTEFSSTGRFFDMLATTFHSIEQADAVSAAAVRADALRFEWDALHIILTRYQHPVQEPLARQIRAALTPYVARHPARISNLVTTLGDTAATIYDLDKRQLNAVTYQRARSGFDAVYHDFKETIRALPMLSPNAKEQ